MPLDTLKIGFYKLKEFINCIKVKRNNLLNSIYSTVPPDFRFKETPLVNFFTDPELSSSLYFRFKISLLSILCILIARMEMGTSRVSGDSDIIT